MSRLTAESRHLTSLVGCTTHYYELLAGDTDQATAYWNSVVGDFQEGRGYSPAEFTALSWAADEIVKKFNREVEDLLYAGQEA